MLSNHFQNGIETAKLVWSRLPSSDDAETEEHERIMNDSGGAESLDYEVIENYAFREAQATRSKLFNWYYAMLKWLIALLIGVGTALAAVFINLAVENFSGWKYAVTFSIIQHSYILAFLVYAIFNVALVFTSVFIVIQFAPAAAESGIPEIKGYLNGVDTHGILLFRTLIGKIFGSIDSVGGGLALGKESPLVHTGACIASLLGQVMAAISAIGYSSDLPRIPAEFKVPELRRVDMFDLSEFVFGFQVPGSIISRKTSCCWSASTLTR